MPCKFNKKYMYKFFPKKKPSDNPKLKDIKRYFKVSRSALGLYFEHLCISDCVSKTSTSVHDSCIQWLS